MESRGIVEQLAAAESLTAPSGWGPALALVSNREVVPPNPVAGGSTDATTQERAWCWRLMPNLRPANLRYWRQCYPNGVGPSVFSSPIWLRLTLQHLGAGWRPCFVAGSAGRGQALSLPMLARTNAWGRYELTIGPISFFTCPIERCHTSCEVAIRSLLASVRTPFTAAFHWYLPPWCIWRPVGLTGGGCIPCARSAGVPWCQLHPRESVTRSWRGQLELRNWAAYLMTVDQSAAEYLARNVRRTQRQHLPASERAGLEVVDRPAPELADEYCRLYARVYEERGWSGPRYGRGFFQAVCNELGRAGELVVIRHRGRVVGGGVLLYDRYACHIFEATTDRAAHGVYPHATLYYTAIERAIQRGLKFVNLGGVGPGGPGLQRFKEDWGARPTPALKISWHSGARLFLERLAARLRRRRPGDCGAAVPAVVQPDARRSFEDPAAGPGG